jgi:hypothetical protein
MANWGSGNASFVFTPDSVAWQRASGFFTMSGGYLPVNSALRAGAAKVFSGTCMPCNQLLPARMIPIQAGG